MNKILLSVILILFVIAGCKDTAQSPTESSNVKEIPSYIQKIGLVSYYAFDGDVNDLSDNKNNGVLKEVDFGTDRLGNKNSSLDFHGMHNEFVEVPFDESMNCPEEMSIAAWVNLQSDSTYQAVASRYIESNYAYQKGWNFAFEAKQNGGHLYFCFRDGSGIFNCYQTSDTVITQIQNEWHHIATTIKFGNQEIGEIYIDGQPVDVKWYKDGRNSLPIDLEIYNNLFIGSSRAEPSGGRSHFFNGKIDDLVIYRIQLTPGEIQSIYDGYTGL